MLSSDNPALRMGPFCCQKQPNSTGFWEACCNWGSCSGCAKWLTKINAG
jgi:hypothetical protein